jgi:hypothetical protein
MPASTRRQRADATTRRILTVLSNDDAERRTEGSWQQLALQDLRQDLETRLTLLQTQVHRAKEAQKQSWFQSMVKIRKNVKSMTLRELMMQQEGGIDLRHLLTATLQGTTSTSTTTSTTSSALSSKKRVATTALATPSHASTKRTAPPSTGRTLKRGEAIL